MQLRRQPIRVTQTRPPAARRWIGATRHRSQLGRAPSAPARLPTRTVGRRNVSTPSMVAVNLAPARSARRALKLSTPQPRARRGIPTGGATLSSATSGTSFVTNVPTPTPACTWHKPPWRWPTTRARPFLRAVFSALDSKHWSWTAPTCRRPSVAPLSAALPAVTTTEVPQRWGRQGCHRRLSSSARTARRRAQPPTGKPGRAPTAPARSTT